MALLAVIIVLYLLSEVFEALDVISTRFAAWMNSETGMIVTIAVVAYLAYRWYRARHAGDQA